MKAGERSAAINVGLTSAAIVEIRYAFHSLFTREEVEAGTGAFYFSLTYDGSQVQPMGC